jgi:non-ribosomal peptide synthetase component F
MSRGCSKLAKMFLVGELLGFTVETRKSGLAPLIMSATVDQYGNSGFPPLEKKELERSICARFEEQVRNDPHRIAVKTRSVTLTYSALNREANRIAQAILNRCGTEPNQLAHLVANEAKSVAAILASLKAAKIYVSLDSSYPRARKLQVLNDAEATLILTDHENLEAARELSAGRQLLNIDAIPSNVPDENPALDIPPDALACIFFTSGSTGRPKGVLHSQRNLLTAPAGYAAALAAEGTVSRILPLPLPTEKVAR